MVLDHALRPLFAYLRTVVVPTGVYAASEDWSGAGADGTAPLTDRIARAASELAGLIVPRQARGPNSDGRSSAEHEEGSYAVREQSGIANFARLLGSGA